VKQYGRNARKHPDRTIAATITTPSAWWSDCRRPIAPICWPTANGTSPLAPP